MESNLQKDERLRRANRRVIAVLVAAALAIYMSSFFLLVD